MGGFQAIALTRKGFVPSAALVTQNTRQKSRNGVDNDGGGDGSVGQNIVANGPFFVDQTFDHSMIDPFVVPAYEDEVASFSGRFFRCGLVKAFALRRHEHDA